MLARLRIRLSDEKNEIRSFKGSAFQGVLFPRSFLLQLCRHLIFIN